MRTAKKLHQTNLSHDVLDRHDEADSFFRILSQRSGYENQHTLQDAEIAQLKVGHHNVTGRKKEGRLCTSGEILRQKESVLWECSVHKNEKD